MFMIEMTMEEVNELIRILRKEANELRTEIHHTDDHDFRQNLKMRLKLIDDMIRRAEANHASMT